MSNQTLPLLVRICADNVAVGRQVCMNITQRANSGFQDLSFPAL